MIEARRFVPWSLLLALVAYRIFRAAGEGWDFETYFAAAKALRMGLNPYDVWVLSEAAGRPIELPFLYSPISALAFVPWTWMPLATAKVGWLALQCALGLGLWTLWRRRFVAEVPPSVLALVGLLAFDAPLLWCLRSGNVELLAQALLWTGLACYAAGRRAAFAALIVAAASFKLLPAAFLVLLWRPRPDGRRDRGLAMAALAAVIALTLVPVGKRLYWRDAFSSLALPRPGPPIESSLLAVVDGVLGPWSDTREGTLAALAVWAGLAALLLWMGRRRIAAAWEQADPRPIVVVAALVFALVAPRMVVYSYLVAVVPAVAVGREVFGSRRARAWALGAAGFQGLVQWLQSDFGWGPVGHLPWLTVAALWVAWVRKPHLGPGSRGVLHHPR